MIRWTFLVLCLLVAAQPLACKRKLQNPWGPIAGDEAGSLQGKPDKVSEEPTGLPGYPLACNWVQSPANDSLNAAVDCFLSDAQGQAVNLSRAPVWSVRYQGPATIQTQNPGNQGVRVNIAAKTRADIELALQNMQVVVNWNGQEKNQAGRDILKSRTSEWRFAASCQNLFTMLMVDSTAAFAYSETNRFNGCEVLSNRLMNVVVPNAAFRKLVDSHKTVGASCSNGLMTLTINQPSFQGSTSVGIPDPQACLDMSSLINSLGL